METGRWRSLTKTTFGRAAVACAWLLVAATSTGAARNIFVVTLDETATTWPKDVVPTALEVPALVDLTVDAIAPFAQQGLKVGDLHGLRVDDVGLVLVAPAMHPSFAFLESLRVVASADGIDPITIASGTTFASGTNFVTLTPQDVDLLPYLRRPHFTLRGLVDAAQAPPDDVTLRLVANLRAYVAEPGAACWQ